MQPTKRPILLTSVLLCLIVIKFVDLIGDHLYRIEYPAQHSYPIEGVETSAATASSLVAAGAEDLTEFLKTADSERGKKVAQKCIQCHVFSKDGGNRVGPNLWGVVGGKIRHMANYVYSKAFQGLEGNWDVKALNEFLYKPSQFAKGTKMSFVGLKNPQERADIIVYMNAMSDQPKTLK